MTSPYVISAVANDSASDAPLRWKYVDDLTLGEIVCTKTANISQLQNDLTKLSSWCKRNDMLPKPEKCHIMHISFLRNQPVFPSFLLNS